MNTRRLLAVAALCTIALLATGCFNPFAPHELGRGISAPPPVANSPGGVLRLFEWAYRNRDISVYRTVFTDDYRFAFGARDSAGKAYKGDTWTRTDELASAKNLFEAASNITLQLDEAFAVFPDPRPGMGSTTYRKSIRTQVLLNIVTQDNNQINVQGNAYFFLVRGDSAVIPLELGLPPDSNRWYIDRWEDETFSGSLVSAALARLDSRGHLVLPARSPAKAGVQDTFDATWGWVKAIYNTNPQP
jgi:hypothetical protein